MLEKRLRMFGIVGIISCLTTTTNLNSHLSYFKGFNNCYILLQKSRQTLENTKVFAGVLSVTLVLCYIVLPMFMNPHKGKNKGKKIW